MEPKLGQKVKDNITQFAGTVTARCEYITGCTQFLVQPPTKDGDFKEPHWFDVDRLAVEAEAPASVEVKTSGFGRQAPSK